MIGDWIKIQRALRQWTQADLAEHSGISLGYLKQLETNLRPNPGGETLSKLAQAFGVTVDELIKGAKSTTVSEELNSASIKELLSLGWSEKELEEIVGDWLSYPDRDRQEIIRLAHEIYRGQQEMEKHQQAQKDKLAELLRRKAST